jgi:hypothetical protein
VHEHEGHNLRECEGSFILLIIGGVLTHFTFICA